MAAAAMRRWWPSAGAVAAGVGRWALVWGAVVGAVVPAVAAPPAGRYRCYQPPAYTVTAWFDREADGSTRLNGGAAVASRYDAVRSLISWSAGAAPARFGIYMPPGTPSGDAERHTIVLAQRAGVRPGQAGWARLERCYLTTH